MLRLYGFRTHGSRERPELKFDLDQKFQNHFEIFAMRFQVPIFSFFVSKMTELLTFEGWPQENEFFCMGSTGKNGPRKKSPNGF